MSKQPLLARLGSARSKGGMRSVMMVTGGRSSSSSFGDLIEKNPHMHRDALIRSDARRLMMKVSTYGPAPAVATSPNCSFMLLGSYALTLVHLPSGECLTLLSNMQLAIKRRAAGAAAPDGLLSFTHCCVSDDDSLACACSGPLVVVFDVLPNANSAVAPRCTEVAMFDMGADAVGCALGPLGAGGQRYAAACDASGAAHLWSLGGSGAAAGSAAAAAVRLEPTAPLHCLCLVDVSTVVLGGSGGLRIWDPHDGPTFHGMQGAPARDAASLKAGEAFGSAGDVQRVAYAESPMHSTACVVSCEAPSKVRLWDVRTGEPLVELGTPEGVPKCAWLARGGRWALTLSGRSALRVFDVRAAAAVDVAALGDASVHLWCGAALSPDNRWLVGLGVTRMGAWEVIAIEVTPPLDDRPVPSMVPSEAV